jgi:hypothetical protein
VERQSCEVEKVVRLVIYIKKNIHKKIYIKEEVVGGYWLVGVVVGVLKL